GPFEHMDIHWEYKEIPGGPAGPEPLPSPFSPLPPRSPGPQTGLTPHPGHREARPRKEPDACTAS
ncbi:hypothetical protein ACFW9F_26305, partial [Streptomyces sp. NPDC059506]